MAKKKLENRAGITGPRFRGSTSVLLEAYRRTRRAHSRGEATAEEVAEAERAVDAAIARGPGFEER